MAEKNKPQVQCDNCSWRGPRESLKHQLADIPKLAERIDVGHEVPAGICPKCDCCCYLVKPDYERPALAACYTLVKAYQDGLANGGSVEWSDIDDAYAYAKKALKAKKADDKRICSE